ncbi:MAG: hypothetical protein RLZZ543_781 [Bacteroidota bacterium]|jgi:hypothetical protein
MKKPLVLTAFTLVFVFFNSCKKCTTCEVKDSNGNIIQAATETCGNTSVVDDAKADARDRATLIGGSYTCTDN